MLQQFLAFLQFQGQSLPTWQAGEFTVAIFQMGEMVQGGAVTLYKLPRTDDRGLCFKESGQEHSELLCPTEDGQHIYGIPVGIHCADAAKLLMELQLPVGLAGMCDAWDFLDVRVWKVL